MITNTNETSPNDFVKRCWSNRSHTLFVIPWNCLTNFVQEQVWEQVQDQLDVRRLKTSEQSGNQVVHVVCRNKIPSYKMLVDSLRIFVLYRFIFYRFLLICQIRKSQFNIIRCGMVFLLKKLCKHYLKTIWEQCSGRSKQKLQNCFSRIIFG